MQVRYTARHGQFKPGDVVDIPDGAAFSADYLEPAPAPPAPPDEAHADAPDDPAEPAPAPVPQLPYPKEM